MTSTTPPWRSLDAPSANAGPAATRPTAAPADAAARASDAVPGTLPVRLIATVVGAVACAVLCVMLILGGGSGGEVVVDGGGSLAGASADPAVGDTSSTGASATLVVEIVGAVRTPGVYHLAPGSRVGDLLGAAGGYGPRVDTMRAERELNLAAPLRDGDQVRVPSRDDEAAGAPVSGGAAAPSGASGAGSGPVDLNRATASELDTLPGIGPVTADKIIAAREEAPFTSVDDLRTRGVVGEKTFERIRASLVVR